MKQLNSDYDDKPVMSSLIPTKHSRQQADSLFLNEGRLKR